MNRLNVNPRLDVVLLGLAVAVLAGVVYLYILRGDAQDEVDGLSTRLAQLTGTLASLQEQEAELRAEVGVLAPESSSPVFPTRKDALDLSTDLAI